MQNRYLDSDHVFHTHFRLYICVLEMLNWKETFGMLETQRTDIIRMWSKIILIWGSVLPSRKNYSGLKQEIFSSTLPILPGKINCLTIKSGAHHWSVADTDELGIDLQPQEFFSSLFQALIAVEFDSDIWNKENCMLGWKIRMNSYILRWFSKHP